MPSLSWDWAWPKPDHRTPSGSSILVQDPASQHPLVGSWIRSGVTGIETRYPKHAFKPLHHRPPHFPYAAPHQDNFVFALVCVYEEFRNLAFYSGVFLKHHSVCAHVAMVVSLGTQACELVLSRKRRHLRFVCWAVALIHGPYLVSSLAFQCQE